MRRDGLIAYQLAVVVDDADQGVTDIVRGIDLLDSTPRQIHLQRLLGFPTPRYAHIPVVEHPDGAKLSKATGAQAIALDAVNETLVKTLSALAQRPPDGLDEQSLPDIWDWAIAHWNPAALVGVRDIALQHYC